MKLFNRTIKAMLIIMAMVAPIAAFADGSKGKPNVFIDYFYRPSEIPFSCAEQLRSYVMEGIVKTNRVELIDVDSREALNIEASRREAGVDASEDPDRMKVMSQEGANFLIQGRVSSLNVTEKTLDSGGKYYTSQLAYTLKVIDPNNGKLVMTKSLKYGGELLNLETADSPEEAITKACRSAVKAVKAFVQEAFPLYGELLECNEVKGDKVNSVYISIGEANGVAPKDRFEVCIVREIAGRKSSKVIGEGEITAVEGEDISVLKIKNGQKEVKAAIDGGQTVVFKSMPKKENIFSGAKL